MDSNFNLLILAGFTGLLFERFPDASAQTSSPYEKTFLSRKHETKKTRKKKISCFPIFVFS